MKKPAKKIIVFIVVAVLLAAFAIATILFYKPHRNVQDTATDFSLNASTLVNEYLKNASAANAKYLAEDGNSKILEVNGIVFSVSEDLNHQKVVLLKEQEEKAGVSCTFTKETNTHAALLVAGQPVTIKGVIRSGASHDSDLGLYENVIMEKCDVIK